MKEANYAGMTQIQVYCISHADTRYILCILETYLETRRISDTTQHWQLTNVVYDYVLEATRKYCTET